VTHVLAAAANADVIARETLFWIVAVASVSAALAMVLVRRAVHCAIMLAVVMLSLATFYAMQGAPFLAFVQIIVYTGAVLMLFLFVLMLIGIRTSDSIVETIKGQRLAAGLVAIGFFAILILGIGHAALGPATRPTAADGMNNLSGIATLIFTRYVFPFEVTGALLVSAALGAMVLAHRERTAPRPTQRDLLARRLASGHLAPDPPPGVYALYNAADRPALLPDGSTADASVSPVLSPQAAEMRAMSDISRADFEALQQQVATHIQTVSGALQAASLALAAASQVTQTQQPSLELVLGQVASERNAINAHTDSLDTKAGLVLGFSGVLVGLSATAAEGTLDFKAALFRAGLEVAVLAAGLAAAAIMTSVITLWKPRGHFHYELNLDKYKQKVADPEAGTRTALLEDQIAMVKTTRTLAVVKQALVFFSVVSLVVAAGLVVAGTLKAEGMHIFL
jgi:NADH-quinone oxidoreductase subunit J